jgi:hypothetical protein
MELLVVVIGLVVLDLLALRFGYDSRDGFGSLVNATGASRTWWSDPTYEQELAREIRDARQRRLVCPQATAASVHQDQDALAQAA